MQTTYITIPAHKMTVNSTAATYGTPVRQLVCLHRPDSSSSQGVGRVIDLSAWKEAHTQLCVPQSEEAPVPKDTAHSSSMNQRLDRLEWVATLAVIGTMAALLWRVLAA